MTVGGKDQQNDLNIFDQRVGRMDSDEIVEEMFDIDRQHNPDFFWVEKGQIWLALRPMVTKEMQRRGRYLNIIERLPIKDKASRGRALQKRMKNSAVKFAKDAHWYAAYEEELLRFTGMSEARLDDQFDSTALLALGFEELPEMEEEDFESEDEAFMRSADPRKSLGQNSVTGY
jgi:predicted phage terminase large subunit-like protein